jgi:NTP pyrophosphatase (non-canonical NTP hydrolase)
MEMADILFVLICMANRERIDLQTAFDRMMEKVETRDRERWTAKARKMSP